jgi:hypothetical protein
MVHFNPRHFMIVLYTAAITSARDQVRSNAVTDRYTVTIMTEPPTLFVVANVQPTFEPAKGFDVDIAEVMLSPRAVANVSVRANTTCTKGTVPDGPTEAARASNGARQDVSPTPITVETLSPNPTLKAASITPHSQKGTLDDHALPSYTPNANASFTESQKTNTEAADSRSHAEPDASLEIGFLVLGVLLALASVVVAVFFGYKQLIFMRNQSSTGRNNVHDSGNGVDLEMGPVVVPSDASDPAGAAIDPAVHNAQPS